MELSTLERIHERDVQELPRKITFVIPTKANILHVNAQWNQASIRYIYLIYSKTQLDALVWYDDLFHQIKELKVIAQT